MQKTQIKDSTVQDLMAMYTKGVTEEVLYMAIERLIGTLCLLVFLSLISHSKMLEKIWMITAMHLVLQKDVNLNKFVNLFWV